LAISACAPSSDPVLTQWFREAGAVVDGGSFGNSTLNNHLAQTSGSAQFAINLQKRFASEVNSTVNFAFNSAALDADAQNILRQQANWIRQFPEVRFRVYGHTDLVGSNSYNKSLGLQRARAVVSFLVHQGVDRSRLEAVASFGETKPLVVTENRERRNRRTMTQVSGFVKGHKNVLDGKYAAIIYRDYVESAVAPTTLTGIQGSDLRTEE
jgi:outer membrane protein OmpA-like peptidoglycan-associated protein